VRRIGLHHMAFFRGYVEGLELARSASLYLESGEDLHAAKRTLQWVMGELVAAARRQQPAMARLLRIPPSRITESRSGQASVCVPSLEEFRAERDPTGFYTEHELIELFEAEFNKGADRTLRKRANRNASLRRRQLEAVRWLESWIAEAPVIHDPLMAWVDESFAAKLERAGLITVGNLMSFIEKYGRRWWVRIPEIGAAGAERLLKWLAMNEGTLGPLSAEAGMAFKERDASLRESRLPSFGVVPLEFLELPVALSGCRSIEGEYAPFVDDLAAIRARLDVASSDNTRRAYRNQIERLLLWATNERGKALSDLSVEDCEAFERFLLDLGCADSAWHWALSQAEWIGSRAVPRWSVDWRPFTGALNAKSRAQAITVIDGCFRWWVKKGYLRSNPWQGRQTGKV
jgi:hypothetical protein